MALKVVYADGRIGEIEDPSEQLRNLSPQHFPSDGGRGQ